MEIDNTLEIDRYQLLSLVKQANRLQLINKLMEALSIYEKALIQLKTLDKYETDYQYLYTSIYRELAIIKFEKSSRRDDLRELRDISGKAGHQDLVSLSSGFILLSYLYEYNCMYCDMKKFFSNYYKLICEEDNTSKNRYNYRLLGEILISLSTFTMVDTKKILELMKKATKVVGDIRPYIEFKDWFYKNFSPYEKAEFDRWYTDNVQPIAQQETYKEITEGLSETNLTPCNHNCRACRQQCCYDGVYLTNEEVELITQLVQTESYFKDIGENFIVNGDPIWSKTSKTKKTAKVWNPDYPDDYPPHFTQTKCIFRLPSGECSLQRFATDNGYNPWKFKPKACWQFPLQVEIIENKMNVNPPLTVLDREQDPNSIGPEYPGYTTYLPCAEIDSTSQNTEKPWYDNYLHEIEYLKLTFKDKDTSQIS